jgi:hypothetical protein
MTPAAADHNDLQHSGRGDRITLIPQDKVLPEQCSISLDATFRLIFSLFFDVMLL